MSKGKDISDPGQLAIIKNVPPDLDNFGMIIHHAYGDEMNKGDGNFHDVWMKLKVTDNFPLVIRKDGARLRLATGIASNPFVIDDSTGSSTEADVIQGISSVSWLNFNSPKGFSRRVTYIDTNVPIGRTRVLNTTHKQLLIVRKFTRKRWLGISIALEGLEDFYLNLRDLENPKYVALSKEIYTDSLEEFDYSSSQQRENVYSPYGSPEHVGVLAIAALTFPFSRFSLLEESSIDDRIVSFQNLIQIGEEFALWHFVETYKNIVRNPREHVASPQYCLYYPSLVDRYMLPVSPGEMRETFIKVEEQMQSHKKNVKRPPIRKFIMGKSFKVLGLTFLTILQCVSALPGESTKVGQSNFIWGMVAALFGAVWWLIVAYARYDSETGEAIQNALKTITRSTKKRKVRRTKSADDVETGFGDACDFNRSASQCDLKAHSQEDGSATADEAIRRLTSKIRQGAQREAIGQIVESICDIAGKEDLMIAQTNEYRWEMEQMHELPEFTIPNISSDALDEDPVQCVDERLFGLDKDLALEFAAMGLGALSVGVGDHFSRSLTLAALFLLGPKKSEGASSGRVGFFNGILCGYLWDAIHPSHKDAVRRLAGELGLEMGSLLSLQAQSDSCDTWHDSVDAVLRGVSGPDLYSKYKKAVAFTGFIAMLPVFTTEAGSLLKGETLNLADAFKQTQDILRSSGLSVDTLVDQFLYWMRFSVMLMKTKSITLTRKLLAPTNDVDFIKAQELSLLLSTGQYLQRDASEYMPDREGMMTIDECRRFFRRLRKEMNVKIGSTPRTPANRIEINTLTARIAKIDEWLFKLDTKAVNGTAKAAPWVMTIVGAAGIGKTTMMSSFQALFHHYAGIYDIMDVKNFVEGDKFDTWDGSTTGLNMDDMGQTVVEKRSEPVSKKLYAVAGSIAMTAVKADLADKGVCVNNIEIILISTNNATLGMETEVVDKNSALRRLGFVIEINLKEEFMNKNNKQLDKSKTDPAMMEKTVIPYWVTYTPMELVWEENTNAEVKTPGYVKKVFHGSGSPTVPKPMEWDEFLDFIHEKFLQHRAEQRKAMSRVGISANIKFCSCVKKRLINTCKDCEGVPDPQVEVCQVVEDGNTPEPKKLREKPKLANCYSCSKSLSDCRCSPEPVVPETVSESEQDEYESQVLERPDLRLCLQCKAETTDCKCGYEAHVGHIASLWWGDESAPIEEEYETTGSFRNAIETLLQPSIEQPIQGRAFGNAVDAGSRLVNSIVGLPSRVGLNVVDRVQNVMDGMMHEDETVQLAAGATLYLLMHRLHRSYPVMTWFAALPTCWQYYSFMGTWILFSMLYLTACATGQLNVRLLSLEFFFLVAPSVFFTLCTVLHRLFLIMHAYSFRDTLRLALRRATTLDTQGLVVIGAITGVASSVAAYKLFKSQFKTFLRAHEGAFSTLEEKNREIARMASSESDTWRQAAIRSLKSRPSAIGATEAQLNGVIMKNLYACTYEKTFSTDTSTGTTMALFENTNLLLVPTHVWVRSTPKGPQIADSVKFELMHVQEGRVEKLSFFIQRDNVGFIPGADTACMHVVGRSRPSLTDYRVTSKDLGRLVVTLHRRSRDGIPKEMIQMEANDAPLTYSYGNSGEIKLPSALHYNHPSGFNPGDCMSVLTAKAGPACIVGMHIAGEGTRGACTIVTADEIHAMEESLRKTALYVPPPSPIPVREEVVGSSIRPVPEVHKNNPVNYLPVFSEPNVLAAVERKVTPRSSLQVNPVWKWVMSKFNLKASFDIPSMNLNRAMYKPLALTTAPAPQVEAKPLRAAVMDYLSPLLARAKGVQISPYPLHQVLNGIPGDQWLHRINTKTSSGFPNNKSKKNYLIEDPETGELSLTPEMLEEFNRVHEEMLLNCEASGLIFDVFPKDEPRPPEKCGAARCIFGGHMIVLMLSIMYLGPIAHFILTAGGLLSNTAIGMDPTSVPYHILMSNLRKGHDKRRGIETDFSSYDLTLNPWFKRGLVYIFVTLAAAIGYTKPEVYMVEILMNEFMCPVVNFGGAIVEAFNLWPSGSFITAIGGSICGTLSYMTSFYKHNADLMEDALNKGVYVFRSFIFLVNLGDDNVGCELRPSNWDLAKYCKDVVSWGMLATVPTNKGTSVGGWTHVDFLTFLKRVLRWDRDFKRSMAALDPVSIFRPFHLWIPNGNTPAQLVDVTRSVLVAFQAHGREAYETVRKGLLDLVEKGALPSCNELLCTFDDVIAADRLKPGYIAFENAEGVPEHTQWELPKLRAHSEEHVGVTTIVDETPVESIPPEFRDPTILGSQERNTNAGQIFDREVRVARFEIPMNNYMWTSFNPMYEYFNNSTIAGYLQGFHRVTADVKVRIEIDAGPSVAGMILMHALPYPTANDPGDIESNQPVVLASSLASVRQHVELMVGRDTSAEMTLRWINVDSAWDVRNYPADSAAWSVRINTPAPLWDNFGRTNAVVCSVYVSLVNYVVTGLSAQSDETPKEKLSSKISVLADFSHGAADLLSGQPSLALPVHLAAETLDGISGVARLLGHSRPGVVSASPTVPSMGTTFSASNVDIPMKKLTVDSDQQISIDSRIFGDKGDELTYASMISREAIIAIIPFTETDTQDTLLFKIGVTPAIYYNRDPAILMPSAIVCTQHMLWRGSMNYRIRAVCHGSTSGRIALHYDPVTVTSNSSTDTCTARLNIEANAEITANIHWTSTRAFLDIAPFIQAGDGSRPASTNGELTITVETPLRGSGTVAASAYLVISAWADPHMVFARHCQNGPVGWDLYGSSAVAGTKSGPNTAVNPVPGRGGVLGNVLDAIRHTFNPLPWTWHTGLFRYSPPKDTGFGIIPTQEADSMGVYSQWGAYTVAQGTGVDYVSPAGGTEVPQPTQAPSTSAPAPSTSAPSGATSRPTLVQTRDPSLPSTQGPTPFATQAILPDTQTPTVASTPAVTMRSTTGVPVFTNMPTAPLPTPAPTAPLTCSSTKQVSNVFLCNMIQGYVNNLDGFDTVSSATTTYPWSSNFAFNAMTNQNGATVFDISVADTSIFSGLSSQLAVLDSNTLRFTANGNLPGTWVNYRPRFTASVAFEVTQVSTDIPDGYQWIALGVNNFTGGTDALVNDYGGTPHNCLAITSGQYLTCDTNIPALPCGGLVPIIVIYKGQVDTAPVNYVAGLVYNKLTNESLLVQPGPLRIYSQSGNTNLTTYVSGVYYLGRIKRQLRAQSGSNFVVGVPGGEKDALMLHVGEHIMSALSLMKIFVPQVEYTGLTAEAMYQTNVYSAMRNAPLLSPIRLFPLCFNCMRGGFVMSYRIEGDGVMEVMRGGNVNDPSNLYMYHAGYEVTDSRVNPMMVVQFPWQSNRRYKVPREGENTEDPVITNLVIRPRGTASVYVDFSVAEDFSLSHFIGSPLLALPSK